MANRRPVSKALHREGCITTGLPTTQENKEVPLSFAGAIA